MLLGVNASMHGLVILSEFQQNSLNTLSIILMCKEISPSTLGAFFVRSGAAQRMHQRT
jgi:hypothetical protein